MQPKQFRAEMQAWQRALAPHAVPLCAAAGAMAGAGLYFALPQEPAAWWGGLVVLLGLGVAVAARTRWQWALAVALIVAAAGFVLGQVQVRLAKPIDYAAAQKPHWLVGTVDEVAVKPDNPKRAVVRLRDVELYGLGVTEVARASVGVFSSQVRDVEVGQGLAIQAVLLPPEPPKVEGQRDGRIWRFWDDARVSGYAKGAVEVTERSPEQGVYEQGWAWLEGLRDTLNARTHHLAGGTVTALLTGEERWVEPAIRDAYRDTGLSHLLAISGMQLTLVGLGIFGVVVWVLGWVPDLALRVNIRLIAALAAMVGVVFYTFLAGASISLVRAMVMSLLVMLAIVAGRTSSGLRAWCVAVVVICLVHPVMVLRAGFQLSAAAVLGLLLLAMKRREAGDFEIKGAQWVKQLALATVVAGAMTAPVVVMQFGQFSMVGLLGNLVAVPLMTLATYAGMLALALWPLGLEHVPLVVMTEVVGVVNTWAAWLAGWEHARLDIPRALGWVLVPCAAAVVGAVLLGRWRWVGASVAVMSLIAFGLAELRPQPEVWVWDGGKVGLVRHGEDYRIAWAESGVEDVQWMARNASVDVQIDGPVSRVVDERLMPVVGTEDFAWARKTAGRWHVQPVACGRPWHLLAEACFEK